MRILLMTYVNRSGSTFLANLLSGSAEICACPEGDWLVSYFLENPEGSFSLSDKNREYIGSRFREDAKLKTWDMDPGVYNRLQSAETNFKAFCIILAQYKEAQKPSASTVLFKAERLAALISKILHLSSSEYRVNVISIIRDPRAVINSQMGTKFPGTRLMMAKEPVRPAVYWRNHTRLVLASGNSNHHLGIRYEDLICGYSETITKLGIYLEIDLSGSDPSSGDYLNRLPPGHLKIHNHAGANPDTTRIDNWRARLSGRDIYLIERICRVEMRILGYKLADTAKDPYADILMMHRLITNFLIHLGKKIRYQIRKRLKLDDYP